MVLRKKKRENTGRWLMVVIKRLLHGWEGNRARLALSMCVATSKEGGHDQACPGVFDIGLGQAGTTGRVPT